MHNKKSIKGVHSLRITDMSILILQILCRYTYLLQIFSFWGKEKKKAMQKQTLSSRLHFLLFIPFFFPSLINPLRSNVEKRYSELVGQKTEETPKVQPAL